MPTGTMAGMTAKDKEPDRGRSAEMDAAVEPVAFGETTGPGVGRAGWPPEAIHQDRAGNRVGRRDERASWPRQAREEQGRPGAKRAQRCHEEDRDHPCDGSGRYRGAE